MNAMLSSVLLIGSLTAAPATPPNPAPAAPAASSKAPAAGTPATPAPAPAGASDPQRLQAMISRFAPVDLRVDVSKLSPADQKALAKLVAAAKVIDEIFLEQYWSGNVELAAKLQQDASEAGRLRRQLFWLYKGPWSSLDDHVAFVPGVPAHRPPGGNFYPEDMTKEEFEAFVKTLPAPEQEQARGYFTVLRRGADKKLAVIPYSKHYAPQLERAAKLLREAAAATDNASLKAYLEKRAAGFLSNDYYESDLAWMEIEAPIEATVGPYETYTDELLGQKAAFEAFITVRDDRETARLAAFSKNLQEIEDHLPVPAAMRNPKLGAMAPIRVVNELIATGDAAHGVRTAAFNLPNDERVVQQKGSKRVMLKNVQQAKFDQILMPLAAHVLAEADRAHVRFDAFFTHILAHELAHGLGLHQITVAGRKTTVRAELKDLYSAIEEAKADITSLYALQYLHDNAERLGMKDFFGPNFERELYTTFLASSFRTMRFGIRESHGKGMALQVNWCLDKKAFVVAKDGTFSVDVAKMKVAVRELTRDLLTLEARGDRAAAKKMLDKLAVLRPPVKAALAKLEALPTDVAPNHVTAESLVVTQK